MRRVLALLAAALVLTPVATVDAGAKTVRVITVGPRFDLDWVQSRAAYAAKLDGMLAPVPLRGRDRDLVVMPEDLGLLAAFSGSRGVPARAVTAETGGLVGAIGTLFTTYAEPNAHYGARFPELTQRGIPTRLLALGLTDTFGRVAVETFAELADRYDVWLEAGVNMAREWRIVCRDKATFVAPPGATGCDVEDPALVRTLGDPDEPQRDYAYEATTPEPVNMALLFDPQGRLVFKQPKAYLTPIELPGQLDLVPGDPDGVDVVKTPVGRLGFVTSKDAWMPDVTGRLDADGVEILVQPEFFVGDTVRGEGAWAPDTLLASGYSDLLRHPSLKAMALPELTGDVYDFSADAQSHIAVRPTPGGPAGRLVGQPTAFGLAQVQPWLAEDSLSLPLAERRRRLAAAGEAALGSGEQQQGVLFQDVEVGGTPRVRAQPRAGRGAAIAPSRFAQANVDVSARGRRVLVAWEERGGVRTAESRDGGRTFSPARRRGAGRSPSVSVGPGGARWLAFERADGKVVVARGRGRAKPVAPGGGRQQRPDVVALDAAGAYVAWIDDRTGLFGTYGARVGGTPERLDEGAPVALAEQLDNAWAPSVAADGDRVLVTWADFRAYKWDVYSRESRDGGASFAAQVRVNDSPEDLEALDDSPQATLPGGEPFVVWTDFRKLATPALNGLYDVFGARPGKANQRLDGDGGRQVNAFAPAAAALPGGRVAVAWQSHRGPTADVALRVGARGKRRRVDGAGTRAVNSWRPSIAALGPRAVLVAWEDDRRGPNTIFLRRLGRR